MSKAKIGVFLALAFGLTWLLDLLLWLAGGLRVPAAAMVLQAQMLLPAFSAILLGLFFFRDNPLYLRENRSPTRWFFYYYLLLTIVYVALALSAMAAPQLLAMASSAGLLLAVAGLLLALALRFVAGRPAYARVGLAGAPLKYWLVFGASLVAFYLLQSLFNRLFGLGQPADLRSLFPPGSAQSMPPTALLATAALNSVVIGPFLGLLLAFGEEYGWRGFLQAELISRSGRIKGILAVGVIWGIWHAPIILMGYNYPGYPLIGILLMTLYVIALAFFLGYAVLKTGSIWLAAYLHALNNQTLGFLIAAAYTPRDAVLSFGIGLFSLPLMALAVFLILRDRIWQDREPGAAPAYSHDLSD